MTGQGGEPKKREPQSIAAQIRNRNPNEISSTSMPAPSLQLHSQELSLLSPGQNAREPVDAQCGRQHAAMKIPSSRERNEGTVQTGELCRNRLRHSALMSASLTTLVHFDVSLSMWARNWAGFIFSTSAPRSSNCFWTSDMS